MERGDVCPDENDETEDEADDGKLGGTLDNIGVDGSWVCGMIFGMEGEVASNEST